MRWRWWRRPSAVDLERWLETGEPAWVERWVDDPDVTGELERLTQLRDDERAALVSTLDVDDGFEDRTVAAVTERVDDLERVGMLFGLLGLGPRTFRGLVDRRDDER